MELFIAFAIAIYTGKLIIKFMKLVESEEFGDDKKKSYQDEMSIYDEQETESPALTPYQTGITLNDLIDGEIPDKAYRKD